MTTMQIRHLREIGSADDSENAEPIVLPAKHERWAPACFLRSGSGSW